MRSWIGRSTAFASVVVIVHHSTTSVPDACRDPEWNSMVLDPMSRGKRTRSKGRTPRSDLDREAALRIHRANNITSVATVGIRYGAYVALAYFFFATIRELSGERTDANLLLGIFADIGGEDRAAEGAMTAVIAFLVFLVHRNRRLWKETVARAGAERRGKELELDPKRSSSGLGHTGDTRPEDGP